MIGITKKYHEQNVLIEANIIAEQGELIAIIGPSGSGKSTLLQIAGLVDKPTSGTVIFNTKITSLLSDDDITKLRLDSCGFVYQFHHLLSEFSALENLVIPQLLRKVHYTRAKLKAHSLLQKLGLEDRADFMPSQLSGGQKQRLAIARSIVNSPSIVFADEPTGNLDLHNSEEVWNLFVSEIRNEGRAMILATHNIDLAKRCDKIFTIKEGVLEECNVMSL